MVSVKIGIEWFLLLIMSIEDYKTKKISVCLLVSFMLCGFGSMLLLNDRSMIYMSLFCSIWIGILGLIVYKVSKKGIGFGDIWLMTSLPFWETGMRFFYICILSIVFSGLCSIFLYLKKSSNSEIAFVPWVGMAVFIYTVKGFL